MPLVSVVTPAYNQARFIAHTMESVRGQDYGHLEHIIVDDGSTDDTLSVIRQYEGAYRMRWRTGPNRGQSAALNSALADAKGEIIGWLNSDDIYLTRDIIASVVEVFARYPGIGVVYGDALEIDESNNIRRLRTNLAHHNSTVLRSFNYITQPATFLRANLLSTNPLDATLQCCMDYDLWLQLTPRAQFRHIDRFVAGVRYHQAAKNLARRDEMRREAEAVRRRYAPPSILEACSRQYATFAFRLKRLTAVRHLGRVRQQQWVVPLQTGRLSLLAARQIPGLQRVFRL